MKLLKVLSLVLIVVLVIGLAACAKKEAGTSDANSQQKAQNQNQDQSQGQTTGVQSQQPVTIEFWHIWSDGASKELAAKIVSDFEASHPNIKVKELGISFWDYWTKLSTAVAGGSGPDVSFNDINNVPARAKAGSIIKLDDYINRDGFNMDQFFPILVDAVKYNGSVYALPLDTDVRVLYYNKAAFKEVGLDPNKPPTNWQELEEYADKLTKWNSKKLLDRIGFSPNMGNLGFWTLAWSNGGDFFDQNGKPTVNAPENIETLQWMLKFQQKYGVKALQAFNTEAGALGYSPFIAGKVAMIVDNNSLYSQIKQYAPNLEFGVAPIPYNKQPVSWSNGFTLEIVDNKNKEKADAAWEFIKYLTGKDVQMQLATKLSDFCANKDVAQDPSLMSDPVWATFVDQMKVSRFREFIEAAPTWFSTVQGEVDNCLNGTKTPQQALDDAQKALENEIANFEKTQK